MSAKNASAVQDPQPSHLAWFLEGGKEYFSGIFAFMAPALQNHERMILFIAPAAESLWQSGDANSARFSFQERQLIEFPFDEFFFPGAVFSPNTVMKSIENLRQQAQVDGFNGLRILVEVSSTCLHNLTPDQFAVLSAFISQAQDNLPGRWLWQYNAALFPPKQLIHFLSLHSFTFSNGKAVQNIFFDSSIQTTHSPLHQAIPQISQTSPATPLSDLTRIYLPQRLHQQPQPLDYYHHIAHDTPFPLWEEDMTEVHQALLELSRQNPTDLRAYLVSHFDAAFACFSRRKVLYTNPAALQKYQAQSLSEFYENENAIFRLIPSALIELLDGIIQNQLQIKACNCDSFLGNQKYSFDIKWTILSGVEANFSRVEVITIDQLEYQKTIDNLSRQKSQQPENKNLPYLGSFEFFYTGDLLICSEEMNRILERESRSKMLTRIEALSYIHPDDINTIYTTINQAIVNVEPFTAHSRIILPSGKVKFVSITTRIDSGSLNPQSRFFGTILDITEQKNISSALEQSEEKYRKLIEQSIDAIVMTDEEGRVKEWNKGAEQIFGLTKAVVLDKPLWEVQSQIALEELRHKRAIAQRQAFILKILRGEGKSIESRPFQIQIRRPDGALRAIQSIIYSIVTEKGRIACSIARDITEEKAAQAVLQTSEERYRILTNLTSDCAYSLSVNHKGVVSVEWVTDSISSILGISSDEFSEHGGFPHIVFPEDATTYILHESRWLVNQTSVVEFRIITKDNRIHWIRDLRKPIWDDELGRIAKIYGAITDITERKITEKAIHESENKFRVLFETMANGVIFRNANAVISMANPAAQRILGRTLYSLQTEDYFDWQHPMLYEDGSVIPEYNHPALVALRTGKEIRKTVLGIYNRIEKRYRWVIANTIPQYRGGEDKPFQVFTTFEDITEIKEAHLALQESENRFRMLIENAPIAIGINRQGKTIYANNKHLKLFGLDHLDEIIDTSVLDQIAEECRQDVARRVEQRSRGISVSNELESTGIRKDGTKFKFRAAITDVQLPDGPATLAFFQDITQQKLAEENLQETNRVLKAIIAASPLSITGVDLEGRITLWTPSAERLYGWKAEEIIGRSAYHGLNKHFKQEFQEILNNTLSGSPYSNHETQRPKKDGDLIDVSLSTSALVGPDGAINGMMIMAVDIRQRKQAETQLEKSIAQLHALTARLQTVREEERSRIAREIHDELGQELTSLKMDLFWIKNRLQKQTSPASAEPIIDKVTSMLGLIDEIINAIRRISTELRPSILDTLGLLPAIEWLAKDFSNRAGIHCTFEAEMDQLDISPETSTVLFRICQEALTNVVRHSRAKNIFIKVKLSDDAILLEIIDNGIGISRERIDDTQSLGLLGMKERAFILGGDVNIRPAEDGGTQVIARIPFARRGEES